MNKIKYLIKEVEEKEVLDLGCVAHNLDLIKKQGNKWMHQIIKDNSKEVIGLDNDKKMIKVLNNKGFKMIHGNAENFNLNKKFDVIFAGELIEHLTNLEGFFNSIKNNLKENGKFILTTPNSTRINAFLRILLKGKSIESPYHTLTFNAFLIKNILKNNGFNNIKIFHSNADYIADKNYLYWFLSFIRKEFKSNLIVECSYNNEISQNTFKEKEQ